MTHPLSLLVVTGTRADFGLWLPVLREATAAGHRVRLIVMAMHLDDRFGRTVEEVERSGFEIAEAVPCTAAGDTLADMSISLAHAIEGATPVVAAGQPDYLLVLGDRGEQLAAALAALHLGTPVVHLHGGERTRGAVDDVLRDLISRIAALHLVTTVDAKATLISMGIDPNAIEVVGAPGLDEIASRDASQDTVIRAEYGVAEGPYLLLVYHPETSGPTSPESDLATIVDAIDSVGVPTIAILPNADAGGRSIAEDLRSGSSRFIGVHPSVAHEHFLTLLAGAAALVGNSSSGIIEAPMLATPAVNVGRRQEGRTRGDNVIDVPPESRAIERAIRRAIDPTFRQHLSGMSPYGDGRAARRIVERITRDATPHG